MTDNSQDQPHDAEEKARKWQIARVSALIGGVFGFTLTFGCVTLSLVAFVCSVCG